MKAPRDFLEVALPLPLNQTFTYAHACPIPKPGTRVLVPFRREERIGWVVGRGSGEGIRKIRPVLDVLEGEPSVPAEILSPGNPPFGAHGCIQGLSDGSARSRKGPHAPGREASGGPGPGRGVQARSDSQEIPGHGVHLAGDPEPCEKGICPT